MLRFRNSRGSTYPCEVISRRTFLRVGGLGAAGLTLADLLRLKAHGAIRSERCKSVIMVYLPGGPSHIDMYDLKPNAPVEFRGEFDPICTNVPGIDICELMPRQAQIADKIAIVRGLKTNGHHDPYELITTGRGQAAGKNPPNPQPAFGCVVSRVRGSTGGGVPPYVGINDLRLLPTYDDPETAAYLGAAYQPFRTSGPGLANLSLPDGVTRDRLAERATLLRTFKDLQHNINRQIDGAVDSFTVQALEIISSNKVRDAFDLSKEPESLRTAYGAGAGADFLLARRLVEAGVSVVTLPARFPKEVGGKPYHWDTHYNNFKSLRGMLPQYDQAVAALISDLCDRGLDKDVAVVIWGEFGREPRVDNSRQGGRGHWPEAGCVLLAGGGLKMGQIIGETDNRAERVVGRPFTSANVLATLYHVLGIDPTATFSDHSGRPRYILDEREPIIELL